jgi:uncharacterized protein
MNAFWGMRHALELWNLAGRCFEGVLLVKRGEISTGLELLRTAFKGIGGGQDPA